MVLPYTEELWTRLLSRILEVSEDSGTATDGSNTTLTDDSKNWETDMWLNATIHIFKDGVEYLRSVSANTATTITFAALPAGISVAAGDSWAVRRPITIADITDRSARLLGVIDSLSKWGGTTLTGRDISLDLANLDVLLSTRAAAAQLPADLTAAGNLKQSIEEQAIALGIDVQARYNLRTFESYTPDVATFYLPSTGSIDLSNFLGSTWFIYATAGATGAEVINCYLQISLDGGTTFRRAAGFNLLDADFVLGEWNSIDVPIMLAQARLEIVCSGEAPGALEAGVIRKA
jgi:hypothetical protein